MLKMSLTIFTTGQRAILYSLAQTCLGLDGITE